MLSYSMSEDGYKASIGPCVGGFVRLSIIRICRAQGWDIPPAVLDEQTELEELKSLNFELLCRRAELRRERRKAKAARRQAEQEARERRLAPEVAVKVAALRERAAGLRAAAQRADSGEDMGRELAEAKRIEADAESLIDSVK